MTNQNHTAATLAAMPDAELDALSAKARGWTLTFGSIEVPCRNGGTEMVREHLYEGIGDDGEAGAIVAACDWQPTYDANQALALLAWASETKGILFDVALGHFAPDERHPHVEAYQPEYHETAWTSGNKWLLHIPGADARVMVIAFILAMQEVSNG